MKLFSKLRNKPMSSLKPSSLKGDIVRQNRSRITTEIVDEINAIFDIFFGRRKSFDIAILFKLYAERQEACTAITDFHINVWTVSGLFP